MTKGAFCLLLGLAAAPSALASETFPPRLKAVWGVSDLGSPDGCLACHTTEPGMTGTVLKPFGKTVVAHGVTAQNVAALGVALGKIKAENVDSDGDGRSDYDEFTLGSDVNVADVLSVDDEPSAQPNQPSSPLGSDGEPAPQDTASPPPAAAPTHTNTNADRADTVPLAETGCSQSHPYGNAAPLALLPALALLLCAKRRRHARTRRQLIMGRVGAAVSRRPL